VLLGSPKDEIRRLTIFWVTHNASVALACATSSHAVLTKASAALVDRTGLRRTEAHVGCWLDETITITLEALARFRSRGHVCIPTSLVACRSTSLVFVSRIACGNGCSFLVILAVLPAVVILRGHQHDGGEQHGAGNRERVHSHRTTHRTIAMGTSTKRSL
jgi:hypothetical protein